MRLHTEKQDLSALEIKNPVVTVGTFDGLHKGHQKIVEHVKQKAHNIKGETVIITFQPHPRVVLKPQDNTFKTLTTHLDKITLFYQYKIDHLVVLKFDKRLAKLRGEEFIQKYLIDRLGMNYLVLGYDNRLGSDQLHDDSVFQALSERLGFNFERVKPLKDQERIISSSLIRDRLATGNIKEANYLLGYEYFVFGRVVFGNRIGKSIGFPTANIEVKDTRKMLPCNGVYIVKVNWNGYDYYGMSNIGIRPTINKSHFTFEVHLFDFHHDIYHDYLTVYFLERIRDEKRFESLQELENQIARDKETALQFLESIE
ncbi:MAG: bifunctional riboflavin kinase/FAD synthetase [Bacteroidales bacterium]|nr:bifunctional riboflavin kinase/FAD synthetase [Bacteroidales bacterium]MCF8332904.1 bifunctional riboflavin kinase/FAD synthetase [Bacteroidales bacterium]